MKVHTDGVTLSGPEVVAYSQRRNEFSGRFPEAMATEMEGEGKGLTLVFLIFFLLSFVLLSDLLLQKVSHKREKPSRSEHRQRYAHPPVMQFYFRQPVKRSNFCVP